MRANVHQQKPIRQVCHAVPQATTESRPHGSFGDLSIYGRHGSFALRNYILQYMDWNLTWTLGSRDGERLPRRMSEKLLVILARLPSNRPRLSATHDLLVNKDFTVSHAICILLEKLVLRILKHLQNQHTGHTGVHWTLQEIIATMTKVTLGKRAAECRRPRELFKHNSWNLHEHVPLNGLAFLRLPVRVSPVLSTWGGKYVR